MYKVDVPLDQPKEKAVEARRCAERERKPRIFNARLRVIGLDLDALNQQVEEKKRRQYIEKQRDQAFDNLKKCQDEEFLQQDSDEREKQRVLHKDLTELWASQQQVKEFHDAKLKCGLNGAFNLTIPEAFLGPSSMHIFEGEGIGEEQIRREKMKKSEKDLQEQMDDNKRRDMRAKHREMLVDRELVQQDLRLDQQAALEEENKRASLIALSSYNQVLAADRAENLKEQRRTEENKNLAEMWHTATSDMMLECKEPAEVGGARPPWVLPDRWRGMSPEQLSMFHKEREQQRIERQRQLEAEKIRNAAWDLQFLKLSCTAEEEEQRKEELRREQRIEMDQYNKQLAREQQANQHYLNKELYTNKPTRDYFCQFNTSSR